MIIGMHNIIIIIIMIIITIIMQSKNTMPFYVSILITNMIINDIL